MLLVLKINQKLKQNHQIKSLHHQIPQKRRHQKEKNKNIITLIDISYKTQIILKVYICIKIINGSF